MGMSWPLVFWTPGNVSLRANFMLWCALLVLVHIIAHVNVNASLLDITNVVAC